MSLLYTKIHFAVDKVIYMCKVQHLRWSQVWELLLRMQLIGPTMNAVRYGLFFSQRSRGKQVLY